LVQQDENFDVIYTNEKIKREEWCTFKVGETRFNDDATRRAGMFALHKLTLQALAVLRRAQHLTKKS
jgi:hypothetical protein